MLAVAIVASASPQAGVPASLDGLIEDFRRGDAAHAVAEFTRWDAKRVALEYEAWDSRRIAAQRFLPAGTDTPDIAALAMLHTLAAVKHGVFGIEHPAAGSEQFHYLAARRLVKSLAPRLSNGEVRAFCRDWFALVTTLWMSARQCARAADTARDGLGLVGADARLFLAAGSVAETQMGPFENGAQVEPGCGEPWAPSLLSRRGSLLIHTRYRRDAQGWLQQAVTLEPGLAEAHLRLGRVLYWSDRPGDARPEFERAIANMTELERPFVGYLAALFLGQLHEDARRVAEARSAYEQAIRLNSEGYVAPVALGHLSIMSGDPGEGWTRVRGALMDGTGSSDRTDPWASYRAAQLWQVSQVTQRLEAWVRR
jgi:tetratricopeptide (TPR) repeat protein